MGQHTEVKQIFRNQNDVSSQSPIQECVFCDSKFKHVQEIASDGVFKIVLPHILVVEPHLLLMPERHIESFDLASRHEAASFLKMVRVAHLSLIEAYGITGYNLHVNASPDGGQEVPHLHVHFFGRFKVEPVNPFVLYYHPTHASKKLLSPLQMQRKVEKLKPIVEKYMKKAPRTRIWEKILRRSQPWV